MKVVNRLVWWRGHRQDSRRPTTGGRVHRRDALARRPGHVGRRADGQGRREAMAAWPIRATALAEYQGMYAFSVVQA